MASKAEVPRSNVEATVVLLMVGAFLTVVFVGLYMAVSGKEMDGWQTVALFFSGFFTGILTAYGLFKTSGK